MTSCATNNDARSVCDVLVTNATVITIDAERQIHCPGAVAIHDRRIAAVGHASDVMATWQGRRVIDAGGAVVHPGFIDPHIHIVHGTCRGALQDPVDESGHHVNFAQWKAGVDSDDERVGTALGSLELLQHGFTTFVEPGSLFDTEAAALAVESLGFACVVCRMLSLGSS